MARRGRGEGSIYRRSDGGWVGIVSFGYSGTGKRQRKYVYGKSKREVQEQMVRLRAESLNGVLAEDPQKVKVSDYLRRWLEDGARPTVRPSTYRLYSGIVRNHIDPRIGGVVLSKLTPIQVQGMYSAMERDGVSARMRHLTHAVLRRALHQAVRWGLVKRNVCDAVDKPRVAKKPMRVLSPDEVQRLLRAAEGDRYYALYLLAVTTGMRQGEMLALHWENVDLKRGAISVQHTLLEVEGKLVLGEPKTASGRRNVVLPAVAVAALKEHRKRMMAEGHPGPWVFCDTKGGPVQHSNLTSRFFKPLLKKAGLPSIRFHDLRHTAATLLLSQGVHPKIVQERLGHSQVSITLDTYSHVLPSMQQEAAAKLDALFAREAGT